MKQARGFSLIELAVAIFVVSLLLGGILVPLATQVGQKQISDTQKTLDEIKEALLGHAVAYGYLPCPDTDNDGLENADLSSGKCSSILNGIAGGNLPWATLGLANSDAWGNRFRYAVREDYSRRPPGSTAFSLLTATANLRVCSTASSCSPSLTSSAVAVVLSHGRNGYGATNGTTGSSNPDPASNDEKENWDNDRDFVSRIATTPDTSAGEFDDIVTWLPLYVLFNRMVMAGKLP